jgi:hypothetical protein
MNPVPPVGPGAMITPAKKFRGQVAPGAPCIRAGASNELKFRAGAGGVAATVDNQFRECGNTGDARRPNSLKLG